MLGELEDEVMNILWKRGEATVKDVMSELARERAYNTVQTTLDRLFRKKLLTRRKHSHSFVYSARVSRADYHRGLISELVGELLPKDGVPVLAAFVDIAADTNPKHLDALEKLIDAKRKAKRSK